MSGDEDNKIVYQSLVKLLQKQDKREFILYTLQNIKRNEIDRRKKKKPEKAMVWLYLFLIQETIKNGGFAQGKKIREKDFLTAMNLVIELNNFVDPSIKESKHSAYKIMRMVSSQQFYLKESSKPQFFGRILLFQEILKEKFSNVNIRFHKYSIDDFLKYTFTIYAWINSHRSFESLLDDDISVVFEDRNRFKNFFRTISTDLSELKSKIDEYHKLKNPQYQILGRSIFIHFPIIRFYDRYFLVSENIFAYFTWRNYFFLLSKEGNLISQLFELYITKIIEHYRIPFKSENKLKSIYGNSKLIDFLIQKEEENLLIECKGIIASDRFRTTQSNEIMINEFKDSIIKAFVQLNTVASKLKSENPNCINYAFIVTLDECYFGDTESLYEEFIREGLEAIQEEFDEDCLPLRNIFIISADDFERMQIVFRQGLSEIFTMMGKLVNWKETTGNEIYFRFWDIFQKFYHYEFDRELYVDSYWASFMDKYLDDIKQFLFRDTDSSELNLSR